MKRKILYIILPIFFFFFNINITLADETVDCADIQEKIDNYNIIKEQLSALDCTNTGDSNIVVACNDYNVRKNIIITELMKLNEKDKVCNDKQDAVDQIIEENKDKCGKIFDDSFSDFINSFMIFFYIAGPILLLFFGSLDFAKATVSSEQDALRKAGKNFGKRVAATALLFATPTIVNIIISFNASDKYLTGNAYSCDYNYLVYTKEYNIKYVPKDNSSTNSSNYAGGSIVQNAEQIHKEYEDEKWVYSTSTLYWGDIKTSINNPKKATCCATFVSAVLYQSGYFSEEKMNSFNYNYADALYSFLKNNNWKIINNYSSLRAGDIVFMDYDNNGVMNHVQIYAGDGSWYNAGDTSSVQKDSPYLRDVSGSFTVALRAP